MLLKHDAPMMDEMGMAVRFLAIASFTHTHTHIHTYTHAHFHSPPP
jgi:hypothetical protein